MYLNATNVAILDYRALNPKCKALDFQIKNIPVINVATFMKFTYLEEINLTAIGIINIPEGLFKYNTQLKKISLYLNRLQKVPKTLLKPLTELRKIYLGSNEIEAIDKDFFAANKKLEIIHLENNKIKQVHHNVFHNLPELRRLWISFNELTSFDFSSLKLSSKLVTIGISCNELSEIHDHHKFCEWFPRLNHLLICGNNFTPRYFLELNESFYEQEIEIDAFERHVHTKDLPPTFRRNSKEYIITYEICLNKEYERILEKENIPPKSSII